MTVDDTVDDFPNNRRDERVIRGAEVRITAKDCPRVTGDIDALVAEELADREEGDKRPVSDSDAEIRAYARMATGQQVITDDMISRHEAGLHIVIPVFGRVYEIPPGVRYQKRSI